MQKQIETIFSGGVFRPLQPVELPENQQITITIPDIDELEDDVEPFWRGVFAPPLEEQELAAFPVVVKTNDLPEMQLEVNIDPRWFEDEHDDTVV